MSVPHSGTRTLLAITGINTRDQGMPEASGAWCHFGADELVLKKYNPRAHIPIRHPLDVARSWAQREKTGDPLNAMLRAYRCMFEYLEDHEAIFHKMEDLPRLKGTDDHKGAPESSAKITRYQDAVREHVIEPNREFFAQFYKDLA